MSIAGTLQDLEVQKFVESPTRVGKAVPEVTVGASALPSGAATAAKQDTQTTELQSINTHLVNLENYTDGLEGFVDGLEGYLDGVESSLSSIDNKLTNPIEIHGAQGALTDRSGTATGTSSQVMATNAARKYLFIQNTGNITIWINFTTAATTSPPSIRLSGGDTFTMEGNFISTEPLNVISSGASVSFTAKEGQ